MKTSKIGVLLATIIILSSCASSYQKINPNRLNYNSIDTKNGISLEYKYNLLNKKYAKKETKKGVKVVSIRVTNNSENDIVFGKDIKLAYQNGNELYLMDKDNIFKSLKQNTATYLLYLLLTPMRLNVTETNGGTVVKESSTPIGLFIGPGIAVGNMVAAGSANKKFKNELSEFDINGATIKKGETKSGLIGIKTDNYDALFIKLK